jgi:hypothetical protein
LNNAKAVRILFVKIELIPRLRAETPFGVQARPLLLGEKGRFERGFDKSLSS